MLVLAQIIAINAFKGSGSFWALVLAHRCFRFAIERSGIALFMYAPALLFVIVAIQVLFECGSEVFLAIEAFFSEDSTES